MRLTNTFTGGKMNKGLDERIIPKGEYRDALNIEVNNSNGAGIGAVENIRGNTNISNYSFTGDTGMVTIGSIANEATNDIYWMVSGTNFDYVLRYNSDTGATTTSLKDTKGRVLKFDSSFLITGINIINNLLFWTDDKNPPRRLNTNISYATDGFTEDDISVIVRPPLNAPEIDLVTLPPSDSPSNNIELKFLQFSYRYKYENNEYSAMSPFSSIAFMPSTFDYDYGDGDFKSMKNTANSVRISLGTGSSLVKEVQVLFRDTLDSTIFVVDRFNKDKEGWISGLEPSNANAPFINFSSDKIYSALPADELTRLFDNVPLKAKAQDIIGSRLVYGNYVQFFDLKDSNNIDIIPEFSLSHSPVSNASFPSRTFKTDRDYEVGIAYLDDYGRMTTVLTSPENSTYIPSSDANKANNLQLEISSVAPSFAKKYRIFIKQNRGLYYNIFPLYYYVDGLYRYFRINRADVDKVKVGEYIIAKTGDDQSIGTGAQYKVLEVEVKDKDFLGDDEIPGLYFKVRIEDPSIFSGIEIEETSMTSTGWGQSFYEAFPPKPYISNNPPGVAGVGVVNIPIYYGSSQTHNNLYILPGNFSNSKIYQPNPALTQDCRIRVYMNSSTTYSLFYFNNGSYDIYDLSNVGISFPQTIPANGEVDIRDPYNTTSFLTKIKFPHSSGYRPGDYWIVNIHGQFGSYDDKTLYGETTFVTELNNSSDPNMDLPLFDTGVNEAYREKNNMVGFAIPCNRPWSPSSGSDVQQSEVQPGVFTQDRPIEAAAVIRMTIRDRNGSLGGEGSEGWQAEMRWVSPKKYANLEEWFWESLAYKKFIQISSRTNKDIGPQNVFFRRGFDRTDKYFPGHVNGSGSSNTNYITQVNTSITEDNWSERITTNPSWMIIKGTGISYDSADGFIDALFDDYTSRPSNIAVKLEVLQSSETSAFETEGKENVDDVFHETNLTLDIFTDPEGRKVHSGSLNGQNQIVGNGPAIVNLLDDTTVATQTNSNFNAYTFGNGVESMVIREDWNGRHLKLSPRVSTTFEDYQQERAEEALTYSGIYRAFGENSAKNNLNEFNLSLANFKYLDKAFGSIQKLNARDTDLVVFQEDKVSKVLFGKNLLSDAVGGGSVASIPEVLGTQISYAGEYGISKNPESFAQWGNDMYFTDEYRGAVCRLGLQGGIFEISSFGMSSWFRDLFIDLPGKQKIGGIDPFKDKYVLTARDVSLSTTIGFEIIDKDPQGG
tara:strand:- start:2120 stop:5794 length:3675 start_codon:yes stop_codon:yes gene_type:complete